ANVFVTCDPTNARGDDPTGTQLYVNVNCFSRPTKLGDIGDGNRNLARRPSIFNTDIALFKNFRWGEKRSIQLRWETYNIFNRTNFSDIDTDLTYGMVQVQSTPGSPCRTASGANSTSPNICTAQYNQTNARFGAAIAARSPRVMQASIKINF